MGRELRVLIDWFPAVAMMALLFALSSQSHLPGPEGEHLNFPLKKLGHLVAYAALALGYLRGLRLARRPFLWALLLTMLYAASDEIHQSTVPLRGASLGDVVLDAVAGGLMLWATRRQLLEGNGALRTVARTLTGVKAS